MCLNRLQQVQQTFLQLLPSIKNANVDFVIVGAIQATMPTIVKEMASQGMTVPAITTYVNVSPAISEQVATDIAGKFDVYGNGWVSYD